MAVEEMADLCNMAVVQGYLMPQILRATWSKNPCCFGTRGFPCVRFHPVEQKFAAKLHADHNNYGLSAIIGLGQFQGGQMFIADPKGDDVVRFRTTTRASARPYA